MPAIAGAVVTGEKVTVTTPKGEVRIDLTRTTTPPVTECFDIPEDHNPDC
jgi:hypothetical protein